MEFVGKSCSGEAVATQSCTYPLGLLAKKTRTPKIMPEGILLRGDTALF